MFVAENLAAGPALGSGSSSVSLIRCWADSELARQRLAEGRHDTFAAPPCMADADPEGIGLCPACYADILGGTA
jgi:hypothetical protein